MADAMILRRGGGNGQKCKSGSASMAMSSSFSVSGLGFKPTRVMFVFHSTPMYGSGMLCADSSGDVGIYVSSGSVQTTSVSFTFNADGFSYSGSYTGGGTAYWIAIQEN